MNVQNPLLPGRIFTGAVALIATGALAVSVVFVIDDQRDDRDVQAAIDQILDARTESRVGNCLVLKGFAEGHNQLVNDDADSDKEFIITLATSGGTREVNPDSQPIIDSEFAKIEQQRRDNLVAVPDCSTPAGIKGLYGGKSK